MESRLECRAECQFDFKVSYSPIDADRNTFQRQIGSN